MYKCKSCGEIFDEPVTKSCYLAEAWGRSIYEDYDTCPCCGSDDFDEYNEEDDEDEN